MTVGKYSVTCNFVSLARYFLAHCGFTKESSGLRMQTVPALTGFACDINNTALQLALPLSYERNKQVYFEKALASHKMQTHVCYMEA